MAFNPSITISMSMCVVSQWGLQGLVLWGLRRQYGVSALIVKLHAKFGCDHQSHRNVKTMLSVENVIPHSCFCYTGWTRKETYFSNFTFSCGFVTLQDFMTPGDDHDSIWVPPQLVEIRPMGYFIWSYKSLPKNQQTAEKYNPKVVSCTPRESAQIGKWKWWLYMYCDMGNEGKFTSTEQMLIQMGLSMKLGTFQEMRHSPKF